MVHRNHSSGLIGKARGIAVISLIALSLHTISTNTVALQSAGDADFDGSGTVGFPDFVIFAQLFGQTVENATAVVRNLLLYPISIEVNGTSVGDVEAGSSREFSVGKASDLKVDWTLVRATLSDGTPIGKLMSGSFDVTNPSQRVSFDVDHVVGSTVYFVPSVTNNSNADFLMVVNWGLESEDRCNCVVRAGRKDVILGYH